MTDLTLFTYDWVPESPRGYVRDLRIRWAYVARATARPSFLKAHADQLAHFAAADAAA